MWVVETGFGSRADHKLSRPPSSIVLNVHSTVSTVATCETHLFGNGYKTYKSARV